ncbi:transcriptional regulator [Xenorhabdus griffiniae]|uniref:transcriptional regulator n=1 Tax=Xenorhabdus griffiniae TaxID=351672 RepID=UPI0030CEF425
MKINEKLKEIESVEKIGLFFSESEPPKSWIAISTILNHKKVEKYSTWFVTGKIAPEAGQISPAIAHNGRAITMSSL